MATLTSSAPDVPTFPVDGPIIQRDDGQESKEPLPWTLSHLSSALPVDSTTTTALSSHSTSTMSSSSPCLSSDVVEQSPQPAVTQQMSNTLRDIRGMVAGYNARLGQLEMQMNATVRDVAKTQGTMMERFQNVQQRYEDDFQTWSKKYALTPMERLLRSGFVIFLCIVVLAAIVLLVLNRSRPTIINRYVTRDLSAGSGPPQGIVGGGGNKPRFGTLSDLPAPRGFQPCGSVATEDAQSCISN